MRSGFGTVGSCGDDGAVTAGGCPDAVAFRGGDEGCAFSGGAVPFGSVNADFLDASGGGVIAGDDDGFPSAGDDGLRLGGNGVDVGEFSAGPHEVATGCGVEESVTGGVDGQPCSFDLVFGEVGLADEGAFGGIDNVEGRPVNVGDTLAIATEGAGGVGSVVEGEGDSGWGGCRGGGGLVEGVDGCEGSAAES